MLSLFRNRFTWLHSFFFSPIFLFLFSSLNFSLYVNNLLLASLRRTSLREQSYVIHIHAHTSLSLSQSLGDLCCWKAKGILSHSAQDLWDKEKESWSSWCCYKWRSRRLGIIWQMKLCEERSRVLGELEEVNWKWSNSDLLKRFLGIREADEELTCSFLEKPNTIFSW